MAYGHARIYLAFETGKAVESGIEFQAVHKLEHFEGFRQFVSMRLFFIYNVARQKITGCKHIVDWWDVSQV